MSKPILAITMGDPAGIGPEITVRALSRPDAYARCRALVVGSAQVLQDAADLLGANVEIRTVTSPAAAADAPSLITVIEPQHLPTGPWPRGEVCASCGEAAFLCIEAAIRLALDREVQAVVTNPIHKKALNLAGHHYAGHTEIFRDLTQAPSSAMMLVEGELRVVHVTTHCSLGEAVRRCKQDRILEVTRLTHQALLDLGISAPRIGMAALNPHASDEGLFGHEEAEEILPAAREARAEGIDVSDPLPADTIFSLAVGGRFDAVVAQYHDQGHIPVKLRGFRYHHATQSWDSVSGINVTLGLPILRVSVDHGTAMDQAWQGKASSESLENAIRFACDWCAR